MTDATKLTAREAVAMLRGGDISPAELIAAALDRIAEVDGAVNALPTLCADRAREAADKIPAGAPLGAMGWLAGLPIAVKDLGDVAGVRTTYGSPIFADHVPRRSDIYVETLERRGAVVLAKSNTPEFGAGANTFNEVFGKTRNPWNTRMTAGGSSGGSAAALATGEVWLATGTDLGGSLRTPAGFCSVVGLRPSPGRVARTTETPDDTIGVIGPMGRNVGDVALMLDAMTGIHADDPLSLAPPPVPFLTAAESRRAAKRVGFSPNLGLLPVAPEIAEICAAAAVRLGELGAEVEEACPDFAGAHETFQTLRAAGYAKNLGPLLEDHPAKLKPEVIWNIEAGLGLDEDDIVRAEAARARLVARVGGFFGDYHILACPVAPVAPFDVDIRYVDEIEGRKLDTYVDWIAITFFITLTGCPALSLPCGFTSDGLPVGLQLVGRPGGEAALLAAAAAAEEMFGIARLLPIDPRAARN